jgi:hypothetical protein
MDKDIKELLTSQATVEIEGLSGFEQGSDEQTKAVANLSRLMDIRESELRTQRELDLKERDLDLKERELNIREIESIETRKQHKTDVVLKCAIGAAQLAFAGFWYGKGFKFETTGTYVSKTFQDLKRNVEGLFKSGPFRM